MNTHTEELGPLRRRHMIGAGLAGCAVLAAGVVGVLQLQGDDPIRSVNALDPAASPAAATSGLAIDLTVEPVDQATVSVTYRIHGTGHTWSAPDSKEPIDFAGPNV